MHFVGHAPQWFESLFRLVSQPLAGFPSQSAKPVAHVAMAQLPDLQLAVALARLQWALHPPQLFTSLVVSTHVPEQPV